MKTLWLGFLGLGLLVVGCGSDPAAAAREPDAGDDTHLAADAQPTGSGGASADTGATGGAGGQVLADGGAGTGGQVGSGGAAGSGTGGTTGSGGAMAGSGGAAGTGGAPAPTYRTCMDVNGWDPDVAHASRCLNNAGAPLWMGGVTGHACVQCSPNPLFVGTQLVECTDGADELCVQSCSECAPLPPQPAN